MSLETNDSSIFHRGTNSETNINNKSCISGTPIHSYILYENIVFHAEQKMIEVDGVRKKIPTQPSHLLWLFLKEKENGYILKDNYNMVNL